MKKKIINISLLCLLFISAISFSQAKDVTAQFIMAMETNIPYGESTKDTTFSPDRNIYNKLNYEIDTFVSTTNLFYDDTNYDLIFSKMYRYYIPEGEDEYNFPRPLVFVGCYLNCDEKSTKVLDKTWIPFANQCSNTNDDINTCSDLTTYYSYESDQISTCKDTIPRCGFDNMEKSTSLTCGFKVNPLYTANEDVRTNYGWTETYNSSNPSTYKIPQDIFEGMTTINCSYSGTSPTTSDEICWYKLTKNWTIEPSFTQELSLYVDYPGVSSCNETISGSSYIISTVYKLAPNMWWVNTPLGNSVARTVKPTKLSPSEYPSSIGDPSLPNYGYDKVSLAKLASIEQGRRTWDKIKNIVSLTVNIEQFIFSAILLLFYIIEIMAIGYMMIDFVPSMFNQIEKTIADLLMLPGEYRK
jgi:hypothetical protein